MLLITILITIALISYLIPSLQDGSLAGPDNLLSWFYIENLEFIYSFLIFSYSNSRKRKQYPRDDFEITDEDIEIAKLYQNSSDLDEDEKTLEFYLKRDREFNGEHLCDTIDSKDIDNPFILEMYKKSIELRDAENKKLIEQIKNAPKDSFLMQYVIKNDKRRKTKGSSNKSNKRKSPF